MGQERKNKVANSVDIHLASLTLDACVKLATSERETHSAKEVCSVLAGWLASLQAELGKHSADERTRSDGEAFGTLARAVSDFRWAARQRARYFVTRAGCFAACGDLSGVRRELELARPKLDQAAMSDGELLRLVGGVR